MSTMKSSVKRCAELLLGVGCALPLLTIVLVTFVDVFARYLFSRPILGSSELIEYCMALTVFSSLPLVSWKGEHVSVSLLNGLKGWGRIVRSLLIGLVSTFAMLLLSRLLWNQATNYLAYDTRTLFMQLPMGYLAIAMSLFSALSALGVILATWNEIHAAIDQRKAESSSC
ncbi:TRAP transporter small permease [Halomonas sp. M5N1S17]|uniref:TRAP transporter small permease n=1 Tax=Halomonas alkalisoli TaxID=2907158 RepID=UPI001F21B534|nr:TRAP transporter small permease [Halomonas alkalisoli]MCE9664693.1 TRAP transporter small permease [Halomonas alkalisoli]